MHIKITKIGGPDYAERERLAAGYVERIRYTDTEVCLFLESENRRDTYAVTLAKATLAELLTRMEGADPRILYNEVVS